MRIRLERVEFMPKQLEPGVLYVSEEYGTAAHLCACGCGQKIRTPLGPTEWEFSEGDNGPSLYPSVGNWQQKCRSHYWITDGEIRWAEDWSGARIEAGRRQEQERREAYFSEAKSSDDAEHHHNDPVSDDGAPQEEAHPLPQGGILTRLWRRLVGWFGRFWKR